MPKVTVLLPVHNAAKFLGESIPSILGQTFEDFELLVMDDGSTDTGIDIVRGFADPRIRLEHNPSNLGIATTLNRGLDMARGDYIARMDADDRACPERLAQQVEHLDRYPNIGVLGSWVRLFGDQPSVVERHPVGADAVLAGLVFDNPLFHPSVMMRRSVLVKHGLRYDPVFSRTEDYELWSRASRYCGLDNLPHALVEMRAHGGNITATTQDTMTQQTITLLQGHLDSIGITADNSQAAWHHHVGRGRRLGDLDEVARAEAWISAVARSGIESGFCSSPGMATAAGMVWFRLCRNCGNLGPSIWWTWRRSRLSEGYKPPVDEYSRWLLSIVWHIFTAKEK